MHNLQNMSIQAPIKGNLSRFSLGGGYQKAWFFQARLTRNPLVLFMYI
ncbi:hypothetical protein NC652_008808 [Populus alba x Populus x berolinensis]|nr:hypothetical protein NC652_008808 [Populus alba x Populus x berolinensis]